MEDAIAFDASRSPGESVHQEPDMAALEFLKDNIGDPSSLIACLNLLQIKNLALIDNIQENMREAIANPVEVVYGA